ncbi:MAG: sigma-70 family RNA polymerase sigma factor [Planctomycetes bacterium]|nr:sigma-70 family RNA polymerase sigma factor [Planctomycetota bacterium]MCW8134310.1 sigma-70 family RNA polymerase sigma factor [Planctomycetota bacterium]
MDAVTESLATGLAAGDEDAWRSLVRSQAEALLRYAAAMTGDADAAQDVVQAAFVRLYRHRRNLRGGTLRALCYSTTGNLARDYLRRRKLRSKPPEPDVNPEPSPELRAIAREAWSAALMLPHDLREVVVLHYGHGLSLAEVGDVVGAPKGTVSTRLRRALDELRERLKYSVATVALPGPDALGQALAGNASLSCSTPVAPIVVQNLELIVMASIGKQGAGTLAIWLLVLLLACGGIAIWLKPWSSAGESIASGRQSPDAGTAGAGQSTAVTVGGGDTPVNAGHTLPAPHPAPLEATGDPAIANVRIFGRVNERDGRPVPHTRVRLGWSVGDGLNESLPEGTTDEHGAYSLVLRLPRIPGQGEVRLFCRVLAWHPHEIAGSATGIFHVDPARSSEHRLDVTVFPAVALAFRVMDAGGSPVGGADIWWEANGWPGVHPHGEVFLLKTGADGWARTRVPYLEGIHSFFDWPVVIVEAARFSAQEYRLEFNPTGPQEFIITLRDATTLEGMLVNGSGEPVRNQAFELELDPEDFEDRPTVVQSLRRELRSDESGRFVIENFPVGAHDAEVRAEGFHETTGLRLTADEFATIPLLRESQSILRVLDPANNALFFSTFTATLLQSDGSAGKPRKMWCGDDAIIRLRGLVPGTYRISARPNGWSSEISTVLEIDEEDRQHVLHVTPPTGTCGLTGRVVLPGDAKLRTAVHLLAAGEREVSYTISSLDDGSFHFMSVEPGDYTLSVHSRDYPTATVPVRVPTEVAIEVHLIQTATLLLRLPPGEPPYLNRWEALVITERGQACTDRWHNNVPGLFRLTGLCPGEVTVIVMSSQFTHWKPFEGDPFERKLTLAPGEIREFAIDDLPRHKVRLRVLYPDGLPVARESLDLKRTSPTEPDPGKYHGTLPEVVTDAHGELLTTWLLPGRYFFNAPDGSRVFFEVEDRPEQTIVVRVPAARTD